jgi:hypothetical protein
VVLGVSQHVLENEYYMIDLFDILEEKRKNKAIDQLTQLQVLSARYMEKEDYTKYITDLQRAAGIKHQEKFSRDKMDALHAFTQNMR